MTVRWTLVVGEGLSTTDLWELTYARARRLTWKLDDPATLSFKLDGRSSQAGHIAELETDVWAYRDAGLGDGPELYYRGRVVPTDDDINEDEHVLQVSCWDYRGLLDRRELENTTLTYVGVDQSLILWTLINEQQTSYTGGDMNITRGTGQTTGHNRDRTYAARQIVGTVCKQLGNVIDGFDWEIDAELALNVYHPQRGGAKTHGLDYGGSVSRVRRSFRPANFANVVVITGGRETSPASATAADLATDPRGRWVGVYSYPDVVIQQTLDDKADYMLAESSKPSFGYELELRPGYWRGKDQLWLGDTTPLRVVSAPRMNVDTTCRITQVDIEIGDSGEEKVTLLVEDVG